MTKKYQTRLVKVSRQVKEWASDNWPPEGWLESYMEGGETLGLANIDLFDFGMIEVSNSLLCASEGRLGSARKHMAFGFRQMIFAEMTDIERLKGSDRTIVSNLDGVTHLILGAVSTGQHELALFLYKSALMGLDGGYGVRDGRKPPFSSNLRYSAFGLSIIADWLGTSLDLNAYALPRDPAWGQLVAHWREPDPDKLLPVLLQACDTHVERIAVTYREANALSRNFEFNSVFLAVHPTEILAILRLRDLLSLPNPLEINHPLMQTPYAEITCQPGEITERDELLERYLATVRQRDPHVLPPGL